MEVSSVRDLAYRHFAFDIRQSVALRGLNAKYNVTLPERRKADSHWLSVRLSWKCKRSFVGSRSLATDSAASGWQI